MADISLLAAASRLVGVELLAGVETCWTVISMGDAAGQPIFEEEKSTGIRRAGEKSIIYISQALSA